MMPEMDGFKVARIIRADERTSHIPLMLLTALNDKTSRIKGWRENVDAYMTKPFDRDELLIQLENMLTIRDILKKKAGQDLSSGQTQSATLTKKDQEFVDRLMNIIHEHYADPLLSRVKLASLMAVSDRQLQRKIKALIDQNPMDILREFRLNTAKQLLRDGHQVSLVADDCGFNSLSYFSQCFKAQFGMSPKKFQQSQ
jgi:AraC-like DNA-binding protein